MPQFSTAVSGTVGVTHLVLSGLTGEFDPSGGNWTKLTVQDGSDVDRSRMRIGWLSSSRHQPPQTTRESLDVTPLVSTVSATVKSVPT